MNVTDVSNHQYVQSRNRVVQFTAEAMAFSLLQSAQITHGKVSPMFRWYWGLLPTHLYLVPMVRMHSPHALTECTGKTFSFLYFTYL